MHTFVARFLRMWVWVWVRIGHPHPHPHPHLQESSNKGMHSIELVEFYLGILFSAFGITCGRIPEQGCHLFRFFAFLLFFRSFSAVPLFSAFPNKNLVDGKNSYTIKLFTIEEFLSGLPPLPLFAESFRFFTAFPRAFRCSACFRFFE